MRMKWKLARKNAGNLFNHLREDYAFKTEACAGVSLGITGLFALYNGYLGLTAGSIWHGSICAFHLVLAAIRGMILYTEWQNRRYGSRQRAVRRRGAGRLLALCAKPAAWRLTGMLGPQEDAFTLPLLPLLAVIACALLWRFLSGIGGCFYQNEDTTAQTPSFTPCLTTAGPYTLRVRPMRRRSTSPGGACPRLWARPVFTAISPGDRPAIWQIRNRLRHPSFGAIRALTREPFANPANNFLQYSPLC